MNHYELLGIESSASQYQIKRAYKYLANQHHPDKGGDEQLFIQIKKAYDTLIDPNKKAEYDSLLNIRLSSTELLSKVFKDPRVVKFKKNKTVNLDIELELYELILGKNIVGDIQLDNGNIIDIAIRIPPGVTHGSVIKYPHIGDSSNPDLLRGDLTITIKEIPHPLYNRYRETDDIILEQEISIFDLILGKTLNIVAPDLTDIEIPIPKQFNKNLITIFNHGYVNNSKRGDLHVKLNITIPELSDEEYDIIRNIQQKY